MDQTTCCVCDRPVEGAVRRLGNRSYCSPCYGRVTRDRRGVWWGGLPGVAALVAVVALAALVLNQVQPRLEGPPLVVAGVLIALVPAVFWLGFFYAQDAREPEPKGYVLAVFALGALLAQAVGIPIVRQVYRTPDWISTSPLVHILGAVLVVGLTQQFLIYAAVRYSIYLSGEFDERIDGVVYGVAAALGYATLVNVDYVLTSGGVDLAAGIIRVAVTSLALASFGGVLGYFIGRCKFEDEPFWWMPAGLALAALLDGLFSYLRGEVTTTGLSLRGGGYNPWPGLLLATAVAGAAFGVLYFLTRRLERQAPAEEA